MRKRFRKVERAARVSKDEDGHDMALMLRDASQRASAAEASALASHASRVHPTCAFEAPDLG
jgi:hypothetical protein